MDLWASWQKAESCYQMAIFSHKAQNKVTCRGFGHEKFHAQLTGRMNERIITNGTNTSWRNKKAFWDRWGGGDEDIICLIAGFSPAREGEGGWLSSSQASVSKRCERVSTIWRGRQSAGKLRRATGEQRRKVPWVGEDFLKEIMHSSAWNRGKAFSRQRPSMRRGENSNFRARNLSSSVSLKQIRKSERITRQGERYRMVSISHQNRTPEMLRK